jgi:starch synthase
MQVDETIPLILYNGRLSRQKGVDLIIEGINEILNDRVQMVLMGNGEKIYENFFEYIENRYQGKFKAQRYNNNLAKKLYAAADIVLMPSAFEPCGLSQMIASRYGTIPIVRETGGLKNSVRDFGCEGGGNGYTFKNYDKTDFVYSIKRAIADFKNDSKDWAKKLGVCIKTDFSWKSAVKEYVALYKKIKKVKK